MRASLPLLAAALLLLLLPGHASAKLEPEDREALLRDEGIRRTLERPKPKQMPLKRARAVMQALRAALQAPDAQEQIVKATAGMAGSGSDARGKRMMVLGPVMEKFTEAVTRKYGFDGGFMQALSSVAAAGEKAGDEEVMSGMDAIREMFTGVKPPSRASAGALSELKRLAVEFLGMDDDAKTDAIERAQAAVEKLTVGGSLTEPGADVYVEVMQGTMENATYVEDEMVDLFPSMQAPRSPDQDLARRRATVLASFLDDSGRRRVKQRVDALKTQSELREL